MKRKSKIKTLLILSLVLLLSSNQNIAQNVGIGAESFTPDPSAGLEVKFSDKGFLPPRMTTAERDAINSPADGLIIFNTTIGCPNYRQNGAWYEWCGVLPAYNGSNCGASTVTFAYKQQTVTYGTVESSGKCWLDRNLGATQIATSSTDEASYGDLFQWGRLDDGHQTRTSVTTSTLSSLDIPNHSNFILGINSPHDWRSPQNGALWQGELGINNPCPSGWRLPTETELNNERTSWTQNNSAEAFASPLKLTVAGERGPSTGSLSGAGSVGRYWCSTTSGTRSHSLDFDNSNAVITNDSRRARGYSVRCIKD